MKKWYLEFIWLLGNIMSYIQPIFLTNFIKKSINRFTTAYVSRSFKKFSKDSVLEADIYLRGAQYISIGKKCNIGKRGTITAWDNFAGNKFNPEIMIGNHVSIGSDCHITAINKIFIGNYVLTGTKITITDNSHGKFQSNYLIIPPELRDLHSEGPVYIEDNVWIGDKVTILPNVTIGKNSIIGANSVVTKNIPSNSLAVGSPAKVVKILSYDV